MALFSDSIDEADGPFGRPSVEDVENSVLVHEVGHLLGLVNLVYQSPVDHEDHHPGHSNNDESVMYWAIESADVSNFILEVCRVISTTTTGWMVSLTGPFLFGINFGPELGPSLPQRLAKHRRWTRGENNPQNEGQRQRNLEKTPLETSSMLAVEMLSQEEERHGGQHGGDQWS